jgi:acetyltransferase-like isoleucine patch superfamily enzyme
MFWSIAKRIAKGVFPARLLYSVQSGINRWRYAAARPRMLDMRIGASRVKIGDTVVMTHPEKIRFGDRVFIWHHTILDGCGGIAIGDGCQIGTKVGLFTHSSHFSIRLYGDRYYETPCSDHVGRVEGPIELGDYCYVGPNSILMPNTRMGKGCLVAAFSYVSGEFSDFSIVAGNPAKVVGDTRRIDRYHLDKRPDLMENYRRWSGQPAGPPHFDLARQARSTAAESQSGEYR